MPRCSGPRLSLQQEQHASSDDDDDGGEYNSEDDGELGNSQLARQLDRDIWVEENMDTLLALYDQLLTQGRALFGDAFLQDGNWADFAHFCYYKTQPFYFPKG